MASIDEQVQILMRGTEYGDEQLKHTALLAHHCFRSYDLAYRCLHLLVERRSLPASAPQDYLAMLRRASR